MDFPPSKFVAIEGFEQRAKDFFEFEQVEKDVFRPKLLRTRHQSHNKSAFGGLIFAQALAAAEKTVSSEFKPHSMHSYFILNVDPDQDCDYKVRRIRDGRSFCTRSVDAVQEGKVAFMLNVSFHILEADSLVHQVTMPTVPHWSECHRLSDAFPAVIKLLDSGALKMKPKVEKWMRSFYSKTTQNTEEFDLFEITQFNNKVCSNKREKHVQMRPTDLQQYIGYFKNGNETQDVQPTKDKVTEDRRFYTWFRAQGDLSRDLVQLHRYLICYNTDSTMVSSIHKPHAAQGFEVSMMYSLEHNIWLHNHEVKADEWLLFENFSPIAGHGRGLAEGRLWREDGTLVLTAMQEALIRSRSGNVSRL